jgi:hypothetical protein
MAKKSDFKHHVPYITMVSLVSIVAIVILILNFTSQRAVVGEAGDLTIIKETDQRLVTDQTSIKVMDGDKPKKEVSCPFTFTPSGTAPSGFKMSDLKLAGVVCLPVEVHCSYSIIWANNPSDIFTSANLEGFVKTRNLAGSVAIQAVPPTGETWSNCQYKPPNICTCEYS